MKSSCKAHFEGGFTLTLIMNSMTLKYLQILIQLDSIYLAVYSYDPLSD